jgi:simple sugar transport system permease protein
MPFRLERRAESSAVLQIGAPLIAAFLTLMAGFVMFAALGKDPLHAMRVFFLFPLKDLYGLSELLLKAAPLMLIAVGLAVGFRANVWNIGAEGQYISGAICASGLALALDRSLDASLLLPLLALAGMAGGMVWAAVPALLRTRFNANEILVSLMLVYVAELLVSWLVHGPWRDPDGFNFPQTRMFEASAVLPPIIEGTRLTHVFLLALIALAAGHLLMQRSFVGFQLRVAGQAPAAARYAGFSASRTVWAGMLCGGAMAGLAGMAEVAGAMGQLTPKVGVGYGFAAIIVAFVGRLHAFGIFLASLLMALMVLGGEQAQQYLALPSSVASVFQGMLLFFLLGTDLFTQYRLVRSRPGPIEGGR